MKKWNSFGYLWVLALLGTLFLGLQGCCGQHTRLDRGRSVSNNIAAQILNPEAGRVSQVVVGQPPEAAVQAYSKYNKSFSPEEKKPLLKLTTEEK